MESTGTEGRGSSEEYRAVLKQFVNEYVGKYSSLFEVTNHAVSGFAELWKRIEPFENDPSIVLADFADEVAEKLNNTGTDIRGRMYYKVHESTEYGDARRSKQFLEFEEAKRKINGLTMDEYTRILERDEYLLIAPQGRWMLKDSEEITNHNVELDKIEVWSKPDLARYCRIV